MKKSILFVLGLTLAYMLAAQEVEISGVVFNDDNKNGIRDKGENGIPGVVVSNQKDVVLTNDDGYYQLEVNSEAACIFVCKPGTHQYLLDENNVPKRHYMHRLTGSPTNLNYKGMDPTGELPKTIDFPLVPAENKTQFRASVVADPQTYTEEQVDWYTRQVLSLMTRDEADMYIALGDIAWDNLDTYKLQNAATKFLNRPIYTVVGNHDLNFRSPDRFGATETYQGIYGPNYYSFNEGDVHFVALNSVSYHGWQKDKNSRGYYHGELHQTQLEWLKNDLKHVPEDKQIVLLTHIPVSDFKDKEVLYNLLDGRKYLLALAGHKHVTQHLYLNETDTLWQGGEFHLHIAASGCGMRYKEAKDICNIPSGLSMDAAPQGYFLYTFKQQNYTYEFIAAKRWENKKMHIAAPSGIISIDSISDINVVANIYDGDNKTEVYCWVNDEGPIKMEQFTGKDPYYGAHMWMTKTNHLWQTDLPEKLSVGTHLVRVVATNRFGHEWSDEMIFRVKE